MRAVRHGAVASALLLVVLALFVALNVRAVLAANTLLAPLAGRAQATVTSTGSDTATVTFVGPAGRSVTTTTPVANAPTSPGTVAFDPADPTRVVLPEHPQLVAADRATTDLTVLALLAATCLALGVQRYVTRRRLMALPPNLVTIARVRQQDRLLSRSWIELAGVEPTQRFPVYFDPTLVTVASPSRVAVYGSGALRALRIDGRWIFPSGRVRIAEPRGRLIDNPSRSGGEAEHRAHRTAPVWRSLVLDSVLTVPAPFVGAFWVFIGGGGINAWVAATVVVAATALWAASVVGTDPS